MATSITPLPPLFNNKTPIDDHAAIPSLQDVYAHSHTHALQLRTQPPMQRIILVMGNESSDYDSTVSASVLAWYLHATVTINQRLPITFIPYINVKRENFLLREEIVFAFSELGIDSNTVTFLDDLDLRVVTQTGQVSVILTDHNRLAAHQSWLGEYVVAIVDHHVDEQLYLEHTRDNRIIEKVGSCCTHVTSIIMNNHPTLLSSDYIYHPIVQLLTDVILIDTHNLDPGLKKAADKDIVALRFLIDTQHYLRFKKLKKLRNNVSGWSTEKLLLKDSKMYSEGGYEVQISTVPMPIHKWQKENPNMIEELVECAKQVDGLIVLTSFTDHVTNEYKRDLLLVVPKQPPQQKTQVNASSSSSNEHHKPKLPPDQFFAALARGLEADPALQLVPVDTTTKIENTEKENQIQRGVDGVSPHAVTVGSDSIHETKHNVLVRRYDQRNISSSRKQVAPCLERVLAKL